MTSLAPEVRRQWPLQRRRLGNDVVVTLAVPFPVTMFATNMDAKDCHSFGFHQRKTGKLLLALFLFYCQ